MTWAGERPAWALAPGVRRVECGRVLIGGSPTTIMRLTEGGAGVLDRALATNAALPSGAAEALVARMERRGMLVATPAPASPDEVRKLLSMLTVIVPVRDDADGLAALLASLTAVPPGPVPPGPMSPGPVPPGGVAVGAATSSGDRPARLPVRTVVVDDGSVDPGRLAAVAARFGGEVVRRSHSGGPGAARAAGLEAVSTPWVVFLDADTTVTPGWLAAAGAHLLDRSAPVDPALALVAPRVAPRGSTGARARYERANSPLDLGAVGGTIAPGTRLAYAPSAAWLVRVDAVDQVGGFDPSLRYGEDVDLIWRLVDAGWAARYEPRSRVEHRVRSSLGAWAEQRFRYGTSAAPLAVRHPGALAPVVTSPWSAAAWALAALGHPLVGVSVAVGSTLALARRLKVARPRAEAMRLAGRGTLAAGPQLARGLIRPWWPALLLACGWRRGRRLAVVALAASAFHGRSAWAIADDSAYAAGVWWGLAEQVRRRPQTAMAALGAVLPKFGGGADHRSGASAKRLRSASGRGESAMGKRAEATGDADEASNDAKKDRSKKDQSKKDRGTPDGSDRRAGDARPGPSKDEPKQGGGSW